ncbi:hypothetical protein Bca4012_098316 [Brassica carinata]
MSEGEGDGKLLLKLLSSKCISDCGVMVNNEDVSVFHINDGIDIDEGEDDVEDLLTTMNQILKRKHKDIEEIISFLDEIISGGRN